MDWDSDPELKELRKAFLASFVDRRDKLRTALLKADSDSIRHIAHKLAGAAESYGYPNVTEVSSALDDWLAHAAENERSPASLFAFATLLTEVLEEALARGQDPADFRADPRFRALLVAAAAIRARF